MISSVSSLVNHGAEVKAAAARNSQILPTVQAHQKLLNDVSSRYPDGNVPADVQKQVVEAVGASVATALTQEPAKTDFGPNGALTKYGTQVSKAQADAPKQWQNWFLICALGQLFFIPMVFVLRGPWSPRKAQEETAAREAALDAELRRLSSPTVDINAPRPAGDISGSPLHSS